MKPPPASSPMRTGCCARSSTASRWSRTSRRIFFRLLEARPALARLLAKILAHAPALADQLARRPELFEGLFDASSFEMPPPAAEFAQLLGRAMSGQPYDLGLDRARQLVNERR